jgi:putative peptidoglycan lipid II flippase
LLVDLGRPKSVDTARLLLSAPGADIELRAGPNPPATASDLRLVASRDGGPASLTLQLTAPVRARYWLVWITSLPASGAGSYSLGIAEIALLH